MQTQASITVFFRFRFRYGFLIRVDFVQHLSPSTLSTQYLYHFPSFVEIKGGAESELEPAPRRRRAGGEGCRYQEMAASGGALLLRSAQVQNMFLCSCIVDLIYS
ncbi:hypothetical protein LINPERPRIM_LOCUS27986 [Linum perenne]